MSSASQTSFKNPVVKWIDERLPIFSLIKQEYGVFPMPRNVNYFWSFGAIATVVLLVLILSGLFLAMQYQPSTAGAFDSVERIMREVNGGWLMRYIHANGASMFFVAIYIHIFRGMYFGSYKSPRELLWIIGVVIFFVMILTAFLGYTLPWGQMSFWGATVITNLFSAIPLVGEDVVTWLWGGYSVGQPTLNRFFVLHYLMPFVLLGLVVLHVWALHVVGANNPAGIEPRKGETVPFFPYIVAKDAVAMIAFAIVFSVFVFYFPNILGHTDNYIPADPLVTPAHIVPEWYFLPFYAVLRAVPDLIIINAKLAGVIAMVLSILILAVAPWLDTSSVRSARYRPIYKIFLYIFALNFVFLGWLGSQPADGIYVTLAQFATLFHFAHFVIIMPFLPRFEKTKPIPTSLSAAVLAKNS